MKKKKTNNKKEKWVKLIVDTKVYPLSTIYAAGYIFLDKAYIFLDKGTKNKIIIWLSPKNKKISISKLKGDFYNELINYAHYFDRVEKNAEVAKMIMQRALFSANPSLASEAEEQKIEEMINQLDNENAKKE